MLLHRLSSSRNSVSPILSSIRHNSTSSSTSTASTPSSTAPLKSIVAPTAREAKKQLQALVTPQRSTQAARALALLGQGSSSAPALERLTHPKSVIGKLIRLSVKNGNLGPVERAMYAALSKLNTSLKSKRQETATHDLAANADFNTWYSNQQNLTIVDQLEKTLRLLAPYIEIKNIRKSGKMYAVPVPVASEARRKSLILRWMTDSIRSHSQSKYEQRLFHELSELRTFKSPLFKKVLSTYETAYANRAYTHFRA